MPPKIPAHVFGYTLATIPGIMYGKVPSSREAASIIIDCPSCRFFCATTSDPLCLLFRRQSLVAIYYKRNHQSDEEFEEMLRKNYSNNIEGSKAKRQEFSTFLQGIKDPTNSADTEKKMEEVLRGGRGESKRHYAVDKELYGTEEGVRLRKEAEDEQKQQTRKKDQRNRGNEGKDVSKDWKDELEKASIMAGRGKSKAKAKKNKKNKNSNTKASGVSSGADGGVSANIGTKQVALVSVIAAGAAGLGFILGGKRQ
jgi:hypothetical protein